MKATRWTATLALTLLAGCGLVVVAQESRDTAKPESEIARAARKNREAKADQKEPAAVFTNEDIERIASGGSSGGSQGGAASAKSGSAPLPKTAPGTKQPVQDPMAWMEERKEQEAEKKRQIQETEAKVGELQQKVQELQKRRLAITNPFLARPKTPDDPEEAEKWDGESVAERRDSTEQALDQARSDLFAAEEKLRRLRSQ